MRHVDMAHCATVFLGPNYTHEGGQFSPLHSELPSGEPLERNLIYSLDHCRRLAPLWHLFIRSIGDPVGPTPLTKQQIERDCDWGNEKQSQPQQEQEVEPKWGYSTHGQTDYKIIDSNPKRRSWSSPLSVGVTDAGQYVRT